MSVLSQEDFDFYRELLVRRTGVLLTDDQHDFVRVRLAPLMRELQMDQHLLMVNFLQGSGDGSRISEKVIEALLVSDNAFFRQMGTYDFLRTICIPELVARNQDQKNLSLWFGGCGAGQEVYSVAVMLSEQCAFLSSWGVRLLGTDVANLNIEKGRCGLYRAEDIRQGLPEHLLHKYFESVGSHWKVKDTVRRRVEFETMNLIDSWSGLPAFDVVFLRNVLLYFDEYTRVRVLEQVTQHMHEQSFLFLGEGEMVPEARRFLDPVSAPSVGCFRLKHL